MTPQSLPAVYQGSDLDALGNLLASSGFFQDARDAAQAAVKVLAGQELGFGPIAAMTGIYIVKGRVTLSANLMAAAIKRHPRYDYRVENLTETEAAITFYQDGEPIGTSDFSLKDAQRAGLAGSENWKKYPRNMLLWRALSNGAKFYCPDAFSGAPVYTPDELGAEVDPETGEILEAVPEPVVPKRKPPKAEEPKPKPKPGPPDGPVIRPEPETIADLSAPDVSTDRVADLSVPEQPTLTSEEMHAEVAHADERIGDDALGKLRALLEEVGAPESAWRMALVAYGASELDELTVGQAREVARRMLDRFGTKTS